MGQINNKLYIVEYLVNGILYKNLHGFLIFTRKNFILKIAIFSRPYSSCAA